LNPKSIKDVTIKEGSNN